MSTRSPADVIREVFRCVEQRDDRRMRELTHPDAEFHWPPALPYGGVGRLDSPAGGTKATWTITWNPLQPTAADRRLDPRIIAASDSEVVVLWWQRGVNSRGERYEGPVLGLYEVREGQLRRAQMFYFDLIGAIQFLRNSA